jgi:hypothetical protein
LHKAVRSPGRSFVTRLLDNFDPTSIRQLNYRRPISLILAREIYLGRRYMHSGCTAPRTQYLEADRSAVGFTTMWGTRVSGAAITSRRLLAAPRPRCLRMPPSKRHQIFRRQSRNFTRSFVPNRRPQPGYKPQGEVFGEFQPFYMPRLHAKRTRDRIPR